MLISFIFSYSDSFFVVIFLLFYFVLGQGPSAHDTKEATREPFSAFVLPEGRLNSVLVEYLSQNNLGELLRLAETLAYKTKARD